MNHPNFCARPNYAYCRQLSLQQLRRKAKQARAQGHYNRATLWYYRSCWQRSGQCRDWLDYLCFRRDLGYLPNRWQQQQLTAQLRQPLLFLLKLHGRLLRLKRASKLHQSTSAAGVASWLLKPLLKQPLINMLQHNQSTAQQQFLSALAKASVTVVGNSPVIKGTARGNEIDAADHVIRFNQFSSPLTSPVDSGQKTTAWCIAPGYVGPSAITAELQWILLAGPDMLFWQTDFSYLEQLIVAANKAQQRAPKIISIPLSHWRKLVRELAAPPSSGLLCIEFLRSQQMDVKAIGFGSTSSNYHIALANHQAVTRHNWPAEANYLHKKYI